MGDDRGVCLEESLTGGMDVWSSSVQSSSSPDHIVIMVHGILGRFSILFVSLLWCWDAFNCFADLFSFFRFLDFVCFERFLDSSDFFKFWGFDDLFLDETSIVVLLCWFLIAGIVSLFVVLIWWIWYRISLANLCNWFLRSWNAGIAEILTDGKSLYHDWNVFLVKFLFLLLTSLFGGHHQCNHRFWLYIIISKDKNWEEISNFLPYKFLWFDEQLS